VGSVKTLAVPLPFTASTPVTDNTYISEGAVIAIGIVVPIGIMGLILAAYFGGKRTANMQYANMKVRRMTGGVER